jgi:hypothetical protein
MNLPDSEQRPEVLPNVVTKVDRQQLQQFVTTIKSAEAQIGEHIINALQHDDTVAVLTTVVLDSDGRQQLVSAALDPDLMREVQELLIRAAQKREDEEPCFGFHCLVKKKPAEEKAVPDTSANETNEGERPF